MNEQNAGMFRYGLEHNIIPHYLFKSGKMLIDVLLQKQGQFFVDLFNSIGTEEDQENRAVCPYTAADYKISPIRVSVNDDPAVPDFGMIVIDMPAPKNMAECCKVMICHDVHFEHLAYFTVELSVGGEYLLCEWNESGSHMNYGPAPKTGEELFHKVVELYVERVWPAPTDPKKA